MTIFEKKYCQVPFINNPIPTFRAALRIRKQLRLLDSFDYEAFYKSIGLSVSEDEYLHSPARFNRCRQYVKAFGLLGSALAELPGRGLSDDEFRDIVHLAHVAPLFDDLGDRHQRTPDQLRKLMRDPRGYKPQDDLDRLFLRLYIPGYDRTPDIGYTIGQMEKMLDREHLPIREQEADKESTLLKGGYSCLVIRSLLREPFAEGEEQMLFHLGKMTQLMDDIFDAPADLEEAKPTYVSSVPDLEALKSDYLQRLRELARMIRATDYPELQKRAFWQAVNLLLTPALNSIAHYRRLGIRRLETGMASDRNPRDLVCDMESVREVRRLMTFSLKQASLYDNASD